MGGGAVVVLKRIYGKLDDPLPNSSEYSSEFSPVEEVEVEEAEVREAEIAASDSLTFVNNDLDSVVLVVLVV